MKQWLEGGAAQRGKGKGEVRVMNLGGRRGDVKEHEAGHGPREAAGRTESIRCGGEV